MSKNRLIVGLEIGTSKICVAVGEKLPDGQVTLLGVGESPSLGVRKGEIVDFNRATQSVRAALADAEEKTDTNIRSVWAAVTGGHLQSFMHQGTTTIPEERGEIDDTDLRSVEQCARGIEIPKSFFLLHAVLQNYHIDNQKNVINPVGMFGQTLKADFHMIQGIKTRIQNTLRCISDVEVEVENVVVNSLASSQVVLDQHAKDLGAIVLDIGGGVTDYLVYIGGTICHTGVLPIGGDHITNDLSIGLRLPMIRAERLKIEEGSADLYEVQAGETLILKKDFGFSGCEVERRILNRIIHVRIRELFELIYKDVRRRCNLELIGAGLFLTGGGAHLKGIQKVAEEVFRMPLHRLPDGVDVPLPFKNPCYSTAIGIIKYAQHLQIPMPSYSLLQKFGKRIQNFFRV